MREVTECPVCRGDDLVHTVTRSHLPAMQNYVYRTAAEARDARVGSFSLAICKSCGFGFNARFDSQLLSYDRGYDNSVPSAVMGAYYEQLADYLNETYLHGKGLIVDVGCGKGTFLRTITSRHPGVRALGIDPSYEGPLTVSDGNMQFIRDIFRDGQLTERPDLVICRHVLEHMQDPVGFVQSLGKALCAYPGVPLFVEVPDLGWILEHQAFWDFCFEHCNYFTAESFAGAVARAGFTVTAVRHGFGNQYLWLEGVNCVPPPASQASRSASQLIEWAATYARSEDRLFQKSRQTLVGLRQSGYGIALWGMATKGVLFSHLIDPGRELIDHCIDINQNKHGCHTPVSGHRIESPNGLVSCASKKLAIVVMNENYAREIADTCRGMGLSPVLLNAAGSQLAFDGGESTLLCA